MMEPQPQDNSSGPREDTTTDRSGADQREIRSAVAAIARDYPAVATGRIEMLVIAAFERRSDATVLQYRAVLAERDARSRLRAEAWAQGAGSASIGAAGAPR